MDDPTLKLQRHLLGSIDLSDVNNKKEESEQERSDYCAAIFAAFPRLEKDIKEFLHTQLMFASNNAENWEQVIFGRGTFNGLSLLLEHWKIANEEYIGKHHDDKENFDKNSPIGEVISERVSDS